MKEKTFRRILMIVIAVGLALTIAHTVYVVYAYQNCSITYFITKEWW